jgi:hypothetical protein
MTGVVLSALVVAGEGGRLADVNRLICRLRGDRGRNSRGIYGQICLSAGYAADAIAHNHIELGVVVGGGCGRRGVTRGRCAANVCGILAPLVGEWSGAVGSDAERGICPAVTD